MFLGPIRAARKPLRALPAGSLLVWEFPDGDWCYLDELWCWQWRHKQGAKLVPWWDGE